MKSPPQPSKSRTNQSYLIFTLAIALIFFPFFILNSISSTILYLSLLFISIGSSLFFWVSFVPFFPKSFGEILNTIQMLILSIFRSTKSAYHIQAGKFDRDYFVIQDKPKLDILLIDENSVVIVINNVGKKRVFPPGYHFIKRGEQVLHTFDRGFHHFFWGPRETKNPNRNQIPDLDLNQTHLHSLRVAQTKWQTKDEITVIPLFSIFYDFSSLAGNKQLEEMSLNISDYFSANNINGELQIEIKNLIGEHVTNIWKVLLENTNTKQLISPTDQISSFMDDILIKINTIINTKTSKNTSDSHKLEEFNLLESFMPVKQWEPLNIRVFLNNIWVQKDVP
jgi:predicted DNA-binding protein YlxM (UPF0122 family)